MSTQTATILSSCNTAAIIMSFAYFYKAVEGLRSEQTKITQILQELTVTLEKMEQGTSADRTKSDLARIVNQISSMPTGDEFDKLASKFEDMTEILERDLGVVIKRKKSKKKSKKKPVKKGKKKVKFESSDSDSSDSDSESDTGSDIDPEQIMKELNKGRRSRRRV